MSSSGPLVTVAIPVYNRQHVVRQAIETALAQTWQPLEVVVSDNCSTDGTWATLQEYAARDPRVRIHRNESNLGAVRNWHRCLELAEGEYVLLLFSDDWIEPDAVERLVRPLRERDDVGFAYASVWAHIYGREPVLWYRGPGGEVPSLRFALGFLGLADVPGSPAAALFRRADLLEFLQLRIPNRFGEEFDSYGIGNDSLLYWRCCARYAYAHHVAAGLVHFTETERDEPGITMSFNRGERGETLRLGYRNAFAYFIATAPLSARRRRLLQTALFLTIVPLRPRGLRGEIRRFGELFPPGYRWWRFTLTHPAVWQVISLRFRRRVAMWGRPGATE